MATKRYTELKNMELSDLLNEVSEAQNQYGKLKLDHATKGLANPLVLRSARKDVARLLTEVRSREVEAMTEAQVAKRDKIRFRRRNK